MLFVLTAIAEAIISQIITRISIPYPFRNQRLLVFVIVPRQLQTYLGNFVKMVRVMVLLLC